MSLACLSIVSIRTRYAAHEPKLGRVGHNSFSHGVSAKRDPAIAPIVGRSRFAPRSSTVVESYRATMPNRTIAIGDIHGCSAALDALLDAIRPAPTT